MIENAYSKIYLDIIKKLEDENNKLKDALEFCCYNNKEIGPFSCKVSALKKIRARAKKVLNETGRIYGEVEMTSQMAAYDQESNQRYAKLKEENRILKGSFCEKESHIDELEAENKKLKRKNHELIKLIKSYCTCNSMGVAGSTGRACCFCEDLKEK